MANSEDNKSEVNDNVKDQLILIKTIEDKLTKQFKVICGSDTYDNEYDTIEEMWWSERILSSVPIDKNDKNNKKTEMNYEESGGEGRTEWYGKAQSYWQNESNAPATIDGMLGGFADLSERDLKFSQLFVEELCRSRSKLRISRDSNDYSGGVEPTRCCECGAGIGRVTKGLLLPLGFEKCDLIETSQRLLNVAPQYIGDPNSSKCRFLCMGLQEYESEPEAYDIVWIQWVIGYLTDWDAVQFFKKMGASLRKGGVIILKDNTCASKAFIVDKEDSSLTRSLPYLMALADLAGLRVVMKRWQEDFPDDIFPVPMIAFEVASGK